MYGRIESSPRNTLCKAVSVSLAPTPVIKGGRRPSSPRSLPVVVNNELRSGSGFPNPSRVWHAVQFSWRMR